MEYACSRDCEGGAERGRLGVFGRVRAWRSGPWEEDEEEQEAGAKLAKSGIYYLVNNIHHCKARPLHPNLRNPQQAGKTSKAVNFMAARNVASARRKNEDVGKGACA